MPIKHIEILESKSENISGVGKASGKPFSFNKQEVYAHKEGNPYPDKSGIILQDDQAPYPVGLYQISNESIYVDRNGRFALSAKLVPLRK
jgi:hypothetical protein